MTFEAMYEAMGHARSTLAQSDAVVRKLASLMAHRLRCAGIDSSVLRSLKRELRGYNIHTRKWNDS